MKGTYQKQGTAVRVEFSGGAPWTIRTSESGSAYFEAGQFRTSSGEADERMDDLAPIPIAEHIHKRIRSLPPGFRLRRLVCIQGSASHRYDEDGERREWTDRGWRMIAQITHRALRDPIIIHTGGRARCDWHAELEHALEVPPRIENQPLPSDCSTFTLSAAASAQLISSLAGIHREITVRGLSQRSSDALDGVGRPVEDAALWVSRDSLPNVLRPSYRTHPFRFPIDAQFDCEEAIERSPEVTFAIRFPVGTPRVDGDTIAITGLTEGNDSRLVALAAPADTWIRALRARIGRRHWFPEEGGVWASESMFDSAEIQLEVPRVRIE